MHWFSFTTTGRVAAGFAAVTVLLFAFTPGARAEGVQVTPIIQEIGRGESMAVYRIKNNGSREVSVEIQAQAWAQRDNERLLNETDHLMVVPAIATIASKSSQVVRIALDRDRPNGELAYRVLFEELPGARPPGFFGLQTRLRIDVPLFFAPSSPASELQWRLRRDDESQGLLLTVVNNGNQHARFSGIKLDDPRGEAVGTKGGPIYVLPGARQRWHFEDNELKVPGEWTLKTRSASGEHGHSLAIE